MIYLAFVLLILGGIAGASYLVVNDHPWFGALVLLIAAGAEFRTRNGDSAQ